MCASCQLHTVKYKKPFSAYWDNNYIPPHSLSQSSLFELASSVCFFLFGMSCTQTATKMNTKGKLGWMFIWVSTKSLVKSGWMGSQSSLPVMWWNVREGNRILQLGEMYNNHLFNCLTNPGQRSIPNHCSFHPSPTECNKAEVYPVMSLFPGSHWALSLSACSVACSEQLWCIL